MNRWRVAELLNRSRRHCWADLVSWAIDGDRLRDHLGGGPDCQAESREPRGACYCAKFASPEFRAMHLEPAPRRAEDVRTIAVIAVVLLMALAGLWLALELYAHARPKVEYHPAPALTDVHPTAPAPGPPVADWRPPQHRWETNHR